MRRVKIIATIGPATNNPEHLRSLVDAGMDVARLNFSHGDYSDHEHTIDTLRQIEEQTGKAIGIMQDLRGPKIRTGVISEGPGIEIQAGNSLTLTTVTIEPSAEIIHVDYPELPTQVKAGDRILLDDGSIELTVESIDQDEIHTVAVTSGLLGSRKGVNLPGIELGMQSMTEKDIEDLRFGLSHGVDAVALSFVQKADDIEELRSRIDELSKDSEYQPIIIAKLERPIAIENLEPILEVSDGVMVARGDLGVEVSPERVPSIQKEVIFRANSSQTIVITATQMLESMITEPQPTRAEASDVANAVFDGSDVLMLSGETAVGKYPVRAVEAMRRIIDDAESHVGEWGRPPTDDDIVTEDDAVALTHAVCTLAHDRNAAAIAVFTFSGRTALLMSKVKPSTPIFAFTPNLATCRRLAMLWGVTPYLVGMEQSVEGMIESVEVTCRKSKLVQPGDQVVLLASYPVGSANPPNFTLLHTIE